MLSKVPKKKTKAFWKCMMLLRNQQESKVFYEGV